MSGTAETTRIDSAPTVVDVVDGVGVDNKAPTEFVPATQKPKLMNGNENVNEMEWDLLKATARLSLFAQVKWPATAAQGTVLQTFDIYQDILTTDISTTGFNRFTFVKWDNILIKINVVGNRLLAGNLGVAFYPSMKTGVTVGGNINFLTTLQNCHLQANQDTSVDFVIPFRFNKEWVDLRTEDCLGQLVFFVMNGFTSAAGGPPHLEIKAWCSFTNAIFKVPLPGVVSFNGRSKGMPTDKELMPSSTTQIVPQRRANPLLVKKHSGLLSLVPDLMNVVVPGSGVIVDLIGGLLDKPQMGEAPDPIVNRYQGFLSNAEGPEAAEHLTLSPKAIQKVSSEHFATAEDEMDAKLLLAEKRTFLKTISVSTTAATGDELFTWRVGPNSASPFLNTGLQDISVQDYVSRMYTQWRGSHIFILEMVMSSFHELRLDITYNPAVDNGLPWSSAITQYTHSVVARAEKNFFVFKVPYLSTTPFKRVYTGGDLTLDPSDTTLPFTDYFLGQFSIFLSSPLIAPTSVAPNVDLNLYMVMGPDYQLAVPNFYGNNLTGISGSPNTDARFIHNADSVYKGYEVIKHSGKGSITTTTEDEMNNYNMNPRNLVPMVLGHGSEDMDFNFEHFGDTNEMSLRDLLKRYASSFRHEMILPTDPTILSDIRSGKRPLINVVEIDTKYGKTYPGIMNYIAAMYRLTRGSDVWKVRASTHSTDFSLEAISSNNLHGWVSFIPYSSVKAYTIDDVQTLVGSFPNTVGPSLSNPPRAFFTEQQTAEFVVPFVMSTATGRLIKSYDFGALSNFEVNNLAGYRLVIAVYVDNLTTQDVVYVDLDRSFGDEKHYGVYSGQPQVQYEKGIYPSNFE